MRKNKLEEWIKQASGEREPVMWIGKVIFKAQDDTRSLVLVTSGILEILVAHLVQRRCKHSCHWANENAAPFGVRLMLLNEIGIIKDELYQDLYSFKRLRNRAAHDPMFELNESDKKDLRHAYQPDAPPLLSHCLWLVLAVVACDGEAMDPILGKRSTETTPSQMSSS